MLCSARWHETRTIFNTPNPRLMNVSLLRDNKLMHSQERRGSRMSMRMPSRQPSMVSLRPHSPNPSLGRQGIYVVRKHGTLCSYHIISILVLKIYQIYPFPFTTPVSTFFFPFNFHLFNKHFFFLWKQIFDLILTLANSMRLNTFYQSNLTKFIHHKW